MKAINEPVKHTENYIQIKDWLKQQDGIVNISGNDGTDRVYLMHAFSSDAHVRLVVTYSEQRMEQLYEDFRFLSASTSSSSASRIVTTFFLM